MPSVKQAITENKGLRTAVLVASLILSLGALINNVYSVIYGVRANTKELNRVEGKVDASYEESKIVQKELYSKVGEVRDQILKDEVYKNLVNTNVSNIKEMQNDLSEIKGDVKVLLSRSN